MIFVIIVPADVLVFDTMPLQGMMLTTELHMFSMEFPSLSVILNNLFDQTTSFNMQTKYQEIMKEVSCWLLHITTVSENLHNS